MIGAIEQRVYSHAKRWHSAKVSNELTFLIYNTNIYLYIFERYNGIIKIIESLRGFVKLSRWKVWRTHAFTGDYRMVDPFVLLITWIRKRKIQGKKRVRESWNLCLMFERVLIVGFSIQNIVVNIPRVCCFNDAIVMRTIYWNLSGFVLDLFYLIMYIYYIHTHSHKVSKRIHRRFHSIVKYIFANANYFLQWRNEFRMSYKTKKKREKMRNVTSLNIESSERRVYIYKKRYLIESAVGLQRIERYLILWYFIEWNAWYRLFRFIIIRPSLSRGSIKLYKYWIPSKPRNSNNLHFYAFRLWKK